MNPELDDPELVAQARLHAALGEPARLAVAQSLLLSDQSPAWLVDRLGVTSNLLAHHINVLADAGVLTRARSEGDRRRVYLQLTPAGRAAVSPASGPLATRRVVFVCTHNSARSQFAEALWRRGSTVPTASAGTHPATRIHPLARRVARSHGVDLIAAAPKPLTDETVADALVVTVCDNADEELPAGVQHLHWSVPDPVAVGDRPAFERAWNDIDNRVHQLAGAVHPPPTRSGRGRD